MEDPRKTGLKNGLRQLSYSQLQRVIDYPGEMVLDTYNYSDGKFCPLAIGVGLDSMQNPSHEKVHNKLVDLGYSVYNTRGISGEFYTINRKEDLIQAAKEVLAEKQIVYNYQTDWVAHVLMIIIGIQVHVIIQFLLGE